MRSRNQRIIYTDRLENNMRKIRRAVNPASKIMAVVKADAYGHGAVETAKAVIAGGADMLAVASVEEGVFLRRHEIHIPILVLGPVSETDAAEGVQNDLILTVCSPEMVFLCEKAAVKAHKQAEVHLKIDTGMGRIGVRGEDELLAVADSVLKSEHVCLSGAYTHFSDADGGTEGVHYTEKQYRRFIHLTKLLPEGIVLHCSNSAAIQRKPEYAMDMVRVGISLYGYPPVDDNPLHLEPCMRWTAKVSFVKNLPAGEYISYGRTFITKHDTRVATVTCGYADGYHRAAGEKAEVLIHGCRAKVLGRICMDQMVVDITAIPDVLPEDEVVLMGQDGNDCITADEIAHWAGTISYEVLLSAGSRVDRIFRKYSKGGSRT